MLSHILLFIEAWQWMFRLLFSSVRNVMSVSAMFTRCKITLAFLRVSHHFHFLFLKHIALVLICERGEEMVSGLLDPFRWLELGLNTSWNKSIAAWCQINSALNPYLGTIGRVRENSYQTAKGHITGFSKCPAVSLILIKIIVLRYNYSKGLFGNIKLAWKTF